MKFIKFDVKVMTQLIKLSIIIFTLDPTFRKKIQIFNIQLPFLCKAVVEIRRFFFRLILVYLPSESFE